MTESDVTYARQLETRLRPVAAAVTAAAGGGRDGHGHPLPGLNQRLEALPDDLDAIREWIEDNQPAKESRRTRR